jgi:hypothetical protein
VFAFAGAAWLSLEILGFFDQAKQQKLQPYWVAFFALGGVYGVFRLWKASKEKAPFKPIRYQITGLDTFVEIVIGDLFSVEGDLIIPASRTFDTAKDGETIDEKSILGQFISRNYENHNHVDADVEKSLASLEATLTLSPGDKGFGRRKEFPLGTCAKLDYKGERAYGLLLKI